MSEELISVRQVKKYYPLRQNRFSSADSHYLHALDDVSFSINKGQIYGVVGESGCGKSTLGRCLLRLTSITDGRICFNGEDISRCSQRRLKRIRPQMQMIFQNPYSSFNPRMRVGASLHEASRVYKQSTEESRRTISQLLTYTSLQDEILNCYPQQLSGGQLQRLAIVRALISHPLFIMADEPVSAMDVSVQAQIINLLLYLRDKFALTMMFVSHELTVVEHICDVVAVMYLGRIVEEAPVTELFSNAAHPYTKALLSARPKEKPGQQTKRLILKGDLPDALELPAGCRFSSRCPDFVKGRCDLEIPELKELSPRHWAACHLVSKHLKQER